MGTTFSGTDLSTLKDKGSKENHFLSLIVNNAGTYNAAITRKVNRKRIIQETVEYNSFDNEEKNENNGLTIEEVLIEYKYLNIIRNKNYSNYDNRFNEISNKKRQKIIKEPTLFNSQYFYDYDKYGKYGNNKKIETNIPVAPVLLENYPENDINKSKKEKENTHPLLLKTQDMKYLYQVVAILLSGNLTIDFPSNDDLIYPDKIMDKLKRMSESMEHSYKVFCDDYSFSNYVDIVLQSLVIGKDENFVNKLIEILSLLPTNCYLNTIIETLEAYYL